MRFSIRYKIFSSFAMVLLINIAATLLFGNQLMETLYLNSKTKELANAYSSLAEIIAARNYDLTMDDTFAEALFSIERNNINILIVTKELDNQKTIHYYSRDNPLFRHKDLQMPLDVSSTEVETTASANPASLQERSLSYQWGPERDFGMNRYNPTYWLYIAEELGVFDETVLPLFHSNVSDERNHGPNPASLDYYNRLQENCYLFLTTPQEPITFAANLAVKYNLYISLCTFLFMAAMSYLVSKKITKPIEDIDAVTKSISQMDFSKQLDIDSGDELEDLSIHINRMSVQLQDYISQLELNQQLLERDLAREAKTNLLRREFIANVSHDFKTPLTLIRAYTETMQNQELLPEEKKEYCQIVLNESERMNKLVTQLLQLSKLESGIVTLEPSLFPIDELLHETLHHNQLQIREKKLHVQFKLEKDYIVYGDYMRIEQVIVNLIENAIKYATSDGILHIVIEDAANDRYRINIANSSPPLTEEQLENIFNSFYKADNSRSLESQSFGLGLAIVKLIMEMHHEAYGVCNIKDGVKFWFELPGIKSTTIEEDYEDFSEE